MQTDRNIMDSCCIDETLEQMQFSEKALSALSAYYSLQKKAAKPIIPWSSEMTFPLQI